MDLHRWRSIICEGSRVTPTSLVCATGQRHRCDTVVTVATPIVTLATAIATVATPPIVTLAKARVQESQTATTLTAWMLACASMTVVDAL
jgi:hypothetical protein